MVVTAAVVGGALFLSGAGAFDEPGDGQQTGTVDTSDIYQVTSSTEAFTAWLFNSFASDAT